MANLEQIRDIARGLADVQMLLSYAQQERLDEQYGTEHVPIWTARIEKLIGWRQAILVRIDELGHGVTE